MIKQIVTVGCVSNPVNYFINYFLFPPFQLLNDCELNTASQAFSATLPDYYSFYCNNHIVIHRPVYNNRKKAENLQQSKPYLFIKAMHKGFALYTQFIN